MSKKSTTEEFIEKARAVHGDKYDYSKVEYKGNKIKVCIICPIHGEFWQRPNDHLSGYGCKLCANFENGERCKSNIDEFIKKAEQIHTGKYDYSKVEYINNHTKVCIICPIHGEFWQIPNLHLLGHGCPYCANCKKIDENAFLERAKAVHGAKYDYSQVEFVDSKTYVNIICSKHGSFWQTPESHLRGAGCPRCSSSRGEKEIERFLNILGVNFQPQYQINLEQKMFSRNNIRVDFYLPKYSTIIEFNGKQHYEYNSFFYKNRDDFDIQVERDKRLKEYCKNNKINLIIIKYKDIDKIEKILEKNIIKLIKAKCLDAFVEVAKDYVPLQHYDSFIKDINLKFKDL